METKNVTGIAADALDCLLSLLAKPSVNGIDNEAAIASFVCEYLSSNGIETACQWVATDRANVVAQIEGRDTGRTVIWNGHLDTVPYGELNAWMSAPDQPHILEDRVVGRGSSDMKGGLAAMLYTLVHMKQRGLKPGCNILFLATCDEEHGGAGANYFRQQFDMSKVHHLLISEPTDCRLGIAQKGCLWLDVEIHGSTSHGAYPEKGVNALEAGMRLYQHLKKVFEQDQHLLLGHSTVTLTRMNGGIAANMVPDSCTLSMDIRLTPAYSGEQVCAEMEAFVQNVLRANGTAIEVSWEIVNNRMAIGLPASHGLYRQYQGVCDAVCDAICDSVSDTQQPIGVRYFTDASLLIASHPNIPVILYGPGRAAQAHQPNESLYWSDFKTALTFYEIVYQMSFE